ncbi:MAG: DUF3135 domain-containing protein [Granulosicoccus sp.]|nr:DUF3135 domain-containing protein [Granulosicoccus sp.]
MRMQQNKPGDFDFDDWAGLYIENPQEFEARRQTVLMLEIARGSAVRSSTAHDLLSTFETVAKGCSDQERMLVAAAMMMESVQQLSAELQVLKEALKRGDRPVQ